MLTWKGNYSVALQVYRAWIHTWTRTMNGAISL